MEEELKFKNFICDLIKGSRCWITEDEYNFINQHYDHKTLGSQFFNRSSGDDITIFGREVTVVPDYITPGLDTYTCEVVWSLKSYKNFKDHSATASVHFMDDKKSTCLLEELDWRTIDNNRVFRGAKLIYANTLSEQAIGWPLELKEHEIKYISCVNLGTKIAQHIKECRERDPDMLPVEWGKGKERIAL